MSLLNLDQVTHQMKPFLMEHPSIMEDNSIITPHMLGPRDEGEQDS